jgi:hypothetical protein
MLYTSISSHHTTMNALTSLIPDRTDFNGWKNWETWNVALWLQNNYAHYKVARQYDSYDRLIPRLECIFGQMTPDGARWMDPIIDTAALDSMLQDL